MKLRNSFGKLLLGGTLAVASTLAAQPASAALLAEYTFDTPPFLQNTANAPGVTASPFGVGPGSGAAQFSTRTATGTGNSRAITFAGNPSSSRTTALGLGTFYNFTIDAVAPRDGIALQNLTFTTDVGNGAGNGSTRGNFFVQANLGPGNAFVDVSSTFVQPATVGANPNGNFITRNVDLSGFTNSTGGTFFTRPLEFRIYQFDNSASTGGGLRVDDVRLNGQVAPVPELSTGLLVALSLGGMCLVSMRRKKGAAPSMKMAL